MTRLCFGLLCGALAACTTHHGGGTCGDGVVDGTEQCDDGSRNGTAGDPCTASCTLVANNAVCGDGIVDGTEQCDDGALNGVAGDHCSATCAKVAYTTATWTFKDVSNGSTTPCPIGFDTAAVHSQPSDMNGTPTAAPAIIDLFTCADGTGMTAALPAGFYVTWIEITDHAGTTVYAQSLSTVVDLTTADKAFAETIYNDGGYFHFAWTLVGAVSASPLTCAQAGAADIRLTATTGGIVSHDVFTCTDASGITAVLLNGTYTLAFEARNSSMATIGSASPLTNRVIQSRNQVTELNSQQINITGM